MLLPQPFLQICVPHFCRSQPYFVSRSKTRLDHYELHRTSSENDITTNHSKCRLREALIVRRTRQQHHHWKSWKKNIPISHCVICAAAAVLVIFLHVTLIIFLLSCRLGLHLVDSIPSQRSRTVRMKQIVLPLLSRSANIYLREG